MKNLIAYIDLVARLVLDEEDKDDLGDEMNASWMLLTAEERAVANHVAKLMSDIGDGAR